MFDAVVAYDPKFRHQMINSLGSPRGKEAALFRELAETSPKNAPLALHAAAIDDARCAFWGDSEAGTRVEARASDADPAVAADGKGEQQLIAWWSAFGNPDEQNKVVDEMTVLAKANPTSDFLANDVHLMIETNPATVEIGQKLTDVECISLARTPNGKAYSLQPNRIDEPLDFEGTTLKGKSFKMKDLRGKVVMVDFWATWCPPCRAEIPHVADLYQQFHDQGFEIIGVSSDNDRVALSSFLKEHTEMPWQELFSAGNGWHPLTKKFGIASIPRMLLVDRSGNLRMMAQSSEAFKELIPKLLAETYVAPPPKSTAKPAGKPLGSIGG
jgi:thiol-disulfide isomerase/thioredoxin